MERKRNDRLGRFQWERFGYRRQILRAIWSNTYAYFHVYTNGYYNTEWTSHNNAYSERNTDGDTYSYSHR